MKDGGNNGCLTASGGMHFGTRKRYVSNAEGDGVVLVPEALEEAETLQGGFVADRESRGLKHDVPDVSSLDKGFLNELQIDMLIDHLDVEKMNDAILAVWDPIAAERGQEG